MPEVISNTTPLHYLHQIGCLDLLPQLYQRVIVPCAVVDELRQGELKGIDVPAIQTLSWVRVEAVAPTELRQVPECLDYGERQTLALALGTTDHLLILDDSAARSHAHALGLRFTGTLGVLAKANRIGLIAEIRPYLDLLTAKGFYLSATVRDKILRLSGEA